MQIAEALTQPCVHTMRPGTALALRSVLQGTYSGCTTNGPSLTSLVLIAPCSPTPWTHLPVVIAPHPLRHLWLCCEGFLPCCCRRVWGSGCVSERVSQALSIARAWHWAAAGACPTARYRILLVDPSVELGKPPYLGAGVSARCRGRRRGGGAGSKNWRNWLDSRSGRRCVGQHMVYEGSCVQFQEVCVLKHSHCPTGTSSRPSDGPSRAS